MNCSRCWNADGNNNGPCSCPCHWEFSEKVQYLLNQNTESYAPEKP